MFGRLGAIGAVMLFAELSRVLFGSFFERRADGMIV